MQDIAGEIERRFGFEVNNIINAKDYYIVITSKGKKVLRKALIPPDKIRFVHGAKEHLYTNSFQNIDRYCCTHEGEPFFLYGGCNFVLTDLCEGREINLDDKNDIIAATRTLALLHRASRGYVPDKRCRVQDDLGKLPGCLKKRLSGMRRLKSVAKKGRSKFDNYFLAHVDYFVSLGEDAVKELLSSCYNRLVEEARKEGIFCHHDYIPSNIMIEKEKTFVMKFEYCCFELKVYDIANLIRRKMRKCGWDIKEAAFILENYCLTEPINRDELGILKIMLQFPQKFWRVANRFYNGKRLWMERVYMLKLEEAIGEKDSHRVFIKQFADLLK